MRTEFTSPYKKNFYVLKAAKPKYYISDGDGKKADNSGYIDLTVTAVDRLFIGSGFIDTDKDGIFKCTDKTAEGYAFIPGSSLKGCVRYLARILSDGCLDDPQRAYRGRSLSYPFELIKCKADKRCIICDMFGMMGRRSKIDFEDLICTTPAFEKTTVNAQFSPNISSNKYHDRGELYGYKLYMNKCEPYPSKQKDRIEAVAAGCVFTGRVYFRDLTDSELELLCYSLGLGGDIDPKLGGYRNEGLGQVRITGSLTLNGREADAARLATKFDEEYEYNIIDKVKDALAPYHAKGGRQ